MATLAGGVRQFRQHGSSNAVCHSNGKGCVVILKNPLSSMAVKQQRLTCRPLFTKAHLRFDRRAVGQIPPKCKETSNLMWLFLIGFILVLFVCWNLFWTITNLKIKCVIETKNTWFTGFFTVLIALAHGVPFRTKKKNDTLVPKFFWPTVIEKNF